jgi:hypothetical protein
LPAIVGVFAVVTASIGGIAGLAGAGLYEAELIGVDASANLIIASVLLALIAIPIGLVSSQWAKRRGQEPVLGQAGMLLGVGTLGAWFVVVVYALGR